MACECKLCQYQHEADEVIKAIDKAFEIECVFVSEYSALSDFMPTEDQVKALALALDIPILKEDYVWEISARLRGSRAVS